MTKRPQNVYAIYHAHVYFDENSVEQARELCLAAAKLSGASMGRVHQRLVGPHPHWSCQLAFDARQFDQLIPWLESHRRGLKILVHGITGNSLEDHTAHASWLGPPTELNLGVFGAPGKGQSGAS
jgi:aromatic ring-cleaving dioxygenase